MINTTQISTPSDRETLITRVIDAPRVRVFDAWTNPAHVPNWMLGPEGWTKVPTTAGVNTHDRLQELAESRALRGH